MVGRLTGACDGAPFVATASDQRIIVRFPLRLAAIRALWRLRRAQTPSLPRPLGIAITAHLGPFKLGSRRL